MITEFANMLGRKMSSVEVTADNDMMIFLSDDGWRFSFYHSQDCCESVSVEDVCGDLSDLVGSPLVMAEEVSNQDREERLTRLSEMTTLCVEDLEAEQKACERNEPNLGLTVPHVDADSYTWTFYRFATAKGNVTVRWLGVSNGYYSEGVTFDEIHP